MKKIIFFLIIFINISIFTQENKINAAGGLDWFTSFNEAVDDAKNRDSIIIVNFTGSDWCSWCWKLEENVFSKKIFHDWVEDNATLLLLDFPQKKELSESQVNHNNVLAQIYGIEGFPTILILDQNGRLITRSGYGDDVNKWITNIEENVKLYHTYVDSL